MGERLGRLAAHEHWMAAAIFAAAAIVYLWPALVGGNPLLPASGLYQLAPWSSAVPSDLDEYFNPSLLDMPASYYAWDVMTRAYLHAGTFPAWNPYAFAGTPLYANPEVALLSPFTLPLWILPLNWALGFTAAVKLWLAGFGTYLLARQLRLGMWPAVVAGLSFTFCTFNVVWLSYGVHVAVAVLLPWLLWLAERIVSRGRSVDALALAGVVALVMTGGHPGTQLHVMVATVLYVLVRAALLRPRDRRAPLRSFGLVGAALALGVLLAAAALLPAQQAALDTAGALARRDGSEDFEGSRLSFAALRALLFPDWWGRPSENPYLAGPANYNERALFAGVVPLLLAVAALLARERWRAKAPFVVLGLLGIAVGLRAPVIRDAVVNAPLFDLVQNQRILLLTLLAVSVLSAFGLEAVLDGADGRRRAWAALAGGVAAAVIAVASVPREDGTLEQALHYVLHRSGTLFEGVEELASVGWFLIAAAAFAALLVLAWRRPRWRAGIGALTALVVALEMLHFAHDFQTMGPPSRAIPPRTPAIAFLQEHRDEGRIAGVGYALVADWSSTYGLRDARGYDAPQPSLRFHRLWTSMNPNQTTHTGYAFPVLSPESMRILALLGTRHILDKPGSVAQVPGVTAVYRGADATVFRHEAPMPRALVAARVLPADEEGAEVAGVMEAAFDPRRDVVVRRDELRVASNRLSGEGSAQVVAEENASVTLQATLARPGVVVLGDAWARGWSVKVDGRPARALQADVVLRGVVVPAGTHTIVWTYRVPGLRLGAALTLAALLAALAWGTRIALRARAVRRTRSA